MVRAKITYAAPKWRDPVTDDQVVLLCRLIDDLASAASSHGAPLGSTPEYERFVLGVHACGFVCSDVTADLSILQTAEKPGWVERAKFKEIRLYLHMLIRAERRYGKNPGGSVQPVQTALRNGVLVRVRSRLRTAQDWRGL